MRITNSAARSHATPRRVTPTCLNSWKRANESHRNELPFAYLIDHDPDVLELYSQPAGEIKLKYRNQDDTRNITARHTPDFFVLHEERAGWGECKMESDLVKLAKKMPFRYQQRPDGSWFCPPGGVTTAEELEAEGTHDVDWAIGQARIFLDAGASMIMIESEGITKKRIES